jgi:hypothetical protein
MSEFSRNTFEYFVDGKFPKMSEFLKNKYFFNEKSPRYIIIPENENGEFFKGKCPSFA